MKALPYLNFNGQCAEAFRYYEQTFNGKIEGLYTFGQMPEGAGCAPGSEELIMHARLAAGDLVLMGSDCPAGTYEKPQGVWVSLHPESVEEAERVYSALAEGGEVTMPLQQTFWAARFAMVTDRFGTPWMINCEAAAAS